MKHQNHQLLVEYSEKSKLWGTTRCIFVGTTSETHYLKINKGGYCSEHKHEYKWNRFFLISGSLRIIIYARDDEQTVLDDFVMTSGDFRDIPPGYYHKFEALEECQCLETYWTNHLDINDINRRTTGGMK